MPSSTIFIFGTTSLAGHSLTTESLMLMTFITAYHKESLNIAYLPCAIHQ